jgi:hypothetical protein
MAENTSSKVGEYTKRYKPKGKQMNQIKVEASGEIGSVYMTQNGMDEANPDRDEFGWEQINTTQRIRVCAERSTLGVHNAGWVWKRGEEIKQ